MHTDPLTASRYPDSTDSPNVAQYIQNLAVDLADNTYAGPFATTAARDSAFAAWVALGNAMRNGLHCHVTGVGDQVYLGSSWRTMPSGEQWGTFAANIGSGANFSSGTLTFPVAFTNTPTVQMTVVSLTAGVDLVVGMTSNPTTTSVGWRVRERSATNGPYTVNVHWVAKPS